MNDLRPGDLIENVEPMNIWVEKDGEPVKVNILAETPWIVWDNIGEYPIPSYMDQPAFIIRALDGCTIKASMGWLTKTFRLMK